MKPLAQNIANINKVKKQETNNIEFITSILNTENRIYVLTIKTPAY